MCSKWSSKGLCNSVTLNIFAGKSLIYTEYHHTVAFEPFKKETNWISNYGASAQAGFVACLCFFGHLARTEIAVLDLEREWFSRFTSDLLEIIFKVINFKKDFSPQVSPSLE